MNANAPRVVVVGSGFAGFFAARTIERCIPPGAAELTIISATAHMCYSPLLPEVAAGRLNALQIAVPLHGALRRTRILQGIVDAVDLHARTVTAQCGLDEPAVIPWDRLVLTLGSVTRTFPVPGLAEHGLGLKTLVEADYIHDHVLRQLEIAAATTDPAVRRARLTFVVVGAGYAGTETAAQLHRMTLAQLGRFPSLSRDDVSWVVLDVAGSVLPELGPRLGRLALSVLRKRGLQVRLGASVTEITTGSVTLSDGSTLPTHTVLWTAGVTPPPLVERTHLPMSGGRLVVDAYLQVRDHVLGGGRRRVRTRPIRIARERVPPDRAARTAPGSGDRAQRRREPQSRPAATLPPPRPRAGGRPRWYSGSRPPPRHPGQWHSRQDHHKALPPVRAALTSQPCAGRSFVAAQPFRAPPGCPGRSREPGRGTPRRRRAHRSPSDPDELARRRLHHTTMVVTAAPHGSALKIQLPIATRARGRYAAQKPNPLRDGPRSRRRRSESP